MYTDMHYRALQNNTHVKSWYTVNFPTAVYSLKKTEEPTAVYTTYGASHICFT